MSSLRGETWKEVIQMAGYGTHSGTVREVVKFLGKFLKNTTAVLAGILIILADVIVGGIAYMEAFKEAEGAFTVPLTDTVMSVAFAFGFGLSVVTSGVQIALWNWLKSNLATEGRMKFRPEHWVAIGFAIILMVVDTGADMAGLTQLMSPANAGGILPQGANPVIWLAFIAGSMVCLLNEAFLDYFFGLDKESKVKEKTRNRIASVCDVFSKCRSTHCLSSHKILLE